MSFVTASVDFADLESGNPGQSLLALNITEELKSKENPTVWQCIHRSSKRRWLKQGLEAKDQQSSIDRLIERREAELSRLAKQRCVYWGLRRDAANNSRERELKEKNTLICRVCQASNIPTQYFKEHSLKCFKITSLKVELKVINDWLIKECEKAQLLKNNVGFDMVIANHITTRGSEDIEDETKSIEIMREAEKKARAVVMEMHKNRIIKFKSKHKKCPTTDDFSKLLQQKQQNQMPDIPQDKDEDGGEGFIPSKLSNMQKIDIQDNANSDKNTIEIQVSKQPTPTKRSADNMSGWTWLSNSSPVNAKKSKPSRFKEIYKKPSDVHEKFKSGESASYDKEAQDQVKNTKELQYVGDLFPSDDENEKSNKDDASDHEKDESDLNEKALKRDDLLDAPDFVDDMFSDKSSGIENKKGKERALKVFSKIKDQNKVNELGASEPSMIQNSIPHQEQILHSELAIQAKFVDRTRSLVVDNPKDSPEDVKQQDAMQYRVIQMSKFSAIKNHKNFSTQVYNKPDPNQSSKEPVIAGLNSDLSECITKAKICHEFFDKLIR